MSTAVARYPSTTQVQTLSKANTAIENEILNMDTAHLKDLALIGLDKVKGISVTPEQVDAVTHDLKSKANCLIKLIFFKTMGTRSIRWQMRELDKSQASHQVRQNMSAQREKRLKICSMAHLVFLESQMVTGKKIRVTSSTDEANKDSARKTAQTS